VSRRNFLKIGALTLGSAMGAQGVVPYRLEAANGRATQDTSVIFVWLPGGPPHMETYDMKPNAPEEYRGEFRPVRTNVPGIDVCEHLPLHTRCADKYTLIRSIAHNFADHGGGHKRFLTGRDPSSPVGFVNDHPMVGSLVARALGQRPDGFPSYVCGADDGRDGIDVFSFGSAYLGPNTHPFMVPGDPAAPTFQVRNLQRSAHLDTHLPARMGLLERFDSVNPGLDNSGAMAAIDVNRQRAMRLLHSDTARRAFDLSQEPLRVRERYGIHRYGQRCLMARRLVEAGASFVTMVLENPGFPGQGFPSDVCYNWDSHAVNCHLYNDCRFRFPMYDRAVTALVEDIHQRGLSEKVLVIVTGEFGRTPRISYHEGRPGRDHWPQAMSVLISGGGLRMGQVVGSTNSRGEHPSQRPMTPNDLWATMFRHLGIDYAHTAFPDHTGRPMPILPYGEPIAELY
jgi:hypothetical protein